MRNNDQTSKQVATAAIKMALSDREQENQLKVAYQEEGLQVAAIDFGGEFNSSIKKIIERAIVAAKREGVIEQTHAEQGAVAGATHEALNQIHPKAVGFDVGGKIGVARKDDHVSVAIFFEIGLLHLNEMAIGLGHRVAN
ncbi:HutP family protein [Natroniella sulfidigena]|uniref:HutP family protein n=1 Tax=Natroniella sulfidigena TaxID=723921 RepID=UPI00200AB836|nr:HutP family protein [Natroniella sulfidigena]MCK8816920.1 HutP family protein [Natroniella sulfidigena]